MGKWSSGFEFDLMKNSKKEYKCFIAKLKSDISRNISDSLLQYLASKDKKSFWNTWKAKINPTKPIARCLVSELDIATSFASTFASNCSRFSVPNAQSAFQTVQECLSNYNPIVPVDYRIDVEYVESLIKKLHKNKTPGVDGITIEHIINAHPCTISILTRLFNLMLLHEH